VGGFLFLCLPPLAVTLEQALGFTLLSGLSAIRTEPKRVGEVDRIAGRKAVEVEPSRQPDRIFLG
jgi:hypothetical protein